MKRYLIFILTAALAASCSPQDPERVDLTDQTTWTTATKSFNVIREGDLDLRDESLWQDEPGTKATYSNLILAVSGIVNSVTSPNVHQVIGTYESTDIHGNPITVSGKIIYPKDKKVHNLMIVSHYTIGSNAECPSEGFSFESIYASMGYAVVIADYIGFGITVKEIHPYLQAETTARNVIDMAIAARPFLKSRNLEFESDEVLLLGYSQGGATTLHVQRLMETFPEYMGMFKIKKNYVGSGPYNIARTYDYCVKIDDTGIPCAIPMIIQGMSIGMDKPLDMDYFFQEPLKSNYKSWLNSKDYTVAQISALIGSNSLKEILTSNARDKSKPETMRFYQELLRNSIPTSYIPEAPLYMFHSEDDQTVPFINSQLMQRQFRTGNFTKVEYNFGHYGNHQKGATKFILTVAGILLEENK